MINFLISFIAYLVTSFYTLSFEDVDGNTINMGQFEGKKILIVNVATDSEKANQFVALQQLQQQYNDSLVVIVFPSNSFGKESRSNSEIRQFCHDNYNNTFLIAMKSNVAGSGRNSVFDWLAKKTKNGEIDAVTGADFQKFLINTDGTLIGVFSSKISPTDAEIVEAITTSF